MGTYERARSAVLRSKDRLRSWIGTTKSARAGADRVRSLLCHWGIDSFTITRDIHGASRAGVCVQTPSGQYVLRQVRTNPAYVEHMLRVMAHLTAVGFPYDVPQVAATLDGAAYVSEGSVHWIMYPFIEGTRATPPSTPARARSLGRLVATYDQAIQTLDLEPVRGQFRLPLFDVEGVVKTLTDATRRPSTGGRRGVAAVLGDDAPAVVAALRALPSPSIVAVGALPTITVYNDWHRFNLIDRRGRLAGLIDYGSVVEAPRIVDVQNALTYVLLSKRTPDRRLASGFLEGYREVTALSRHEASLVYPVWVDRIAWLVADIAAEVRRAGTSTRGGLALQLLGLFSWLTAHERECLQLLDAIA